MDVLDAERQKKAAEYAGRQRLFGKIKFALTIVLLAALLFTPLSVKLAEILPAATVPAVIIYTAILFMVHELVTLPLNYLGGLKLPRQYGLSRQDFSGWLGDHFKSLLIGLVFTLTAVVAVYGLMLWSPDRWWFFAWAGLMLTSLILTVLAPVLLIPLFFKMKPMDDGEIKDRLEALAMRTGVKVGGIYIIEFAAKTTQANAAVMGLGSTKRIAISDTLLEQYSAAEIELVMAHELAHQRHNDVWKLFAFQGTVFLGVFGITAMMFEKAVSYFSYVNLADPAGLPLLVVCFMIAGLPALPLLACFSRRREKAADKYALELTNNPDVFISAMTRLTDQNLSEAWSSSLIERLGQDHPSYIDRVKMAEDFAARNRCSD